VVSEEATSKGHDNARQSRALDSGTPLGKLVRKGVQSLSKMRAKVLTATPDTSRTQVSSMPKAAPATGLGDTVRDIMKSNGIVGAKQWSTSGFRLPGGDKDDASRRAHDALDQLGIALTGSRSLDTTTSPHALTHHERGTLDTFIRSIPQMKPDVVASRDEQFAGLARELVRQFKGSLDAPGLNQLATSAVALARDEALGGHEHKHSKMDEFMASAHKTKDMSRAKATVYTALHMLPVGPGVLVGEVGGRWMHHMLKSDKTSSKAMALVTDVVKQMDKGTMDDAVFEQAKALVDASPASRSRAPALLKELRRVATEEQALLLA
jgi:hypothetical protein